MSFSPSFLCLLCAESQGGDIRWSNADGPNDSGHSENTLITVEALRTCFRNVSIVPVAARWLCHISLSLSLFLSVFSSLVAVLPNVRDIRSTAWVCTTFSCNWRLNYRIAPSLGFHAHVCHSHTSPRINFRELKKKKISERNFSSCYLFFLTLRKMLRCRCRNYPDPTVIPIYADYSFARIRVTRGSVRIT